MVPPGAALEELGVSLMAKSATRTVTLLVAVSLAAITLLVELSITEPEMTVLPVVPGFTVTTRVNVAAPRLANEEPSVHVTVPAAPKAGLTQFQPAGGVTEAKVVFVGVFCVHQGRLAGEGPLLVTTIV